MYEQALVSLQYSEMLGILRRHAETPMGRACVDALGPSTDRDKITRLVREATECQKLRQSGVFWSLSQLSDPADTLGRLRIEGVVLEPLKLLELAYLCGQAARLRDSITDNQQQCPTLWNLLKDLPAGLEKLAHKITRRILPDGDLDDHASPELARIRSDIVRLRSSITRSLERLMRSVDEAIRDQLITIRNDRFVIPVRSDMRGVVPGVTHGSSSSGATLFVEPLDAIESNNDFQLLREMEAREITRILATLTEELRNELPGIEEASRVIARFDFAAARAAFAAGTNATAPEITDEKRLELVAARHPLLEERLRGTPNSIVPVTIMLNPEQTVMIVSGANAGGKTVILKTTGLLVLMALSGLHVPAERAIAPLYTSVLADIGDQQSIASNLSTFTSHISNIRRMIDECQTSKGPGLVLLDEVGTGTDPEEGSALGVAIIEYFRTECGAHVIATTHYNGLKIYAASNEPVMNASVEFDEESLEPTYKLIIGMAGSSSGVEIAGRFGLPAKIVSAAAAGVSESSRTAAEYISQLRYELQKTTDLRKALEEERATVADRYAALEMNAARRERERKATFEREIEKALVDLQKKSQPILEKLEDRVARARAERETEKRTAELRRSARQSLRRATDEQPKPTVPEVKVIRRSHQAGGAPVLFKEPRGSKPGLTRPLRAGDRVRLRTLGAEGIIESVKGEEAEIRIGSMRLRERKDNLEILAAEQKSEAVSGNLLEELARATDKGIYLKAGQREISEELNIIGQTTDEAAESVDKYLDAAYIQNFGHVRIVHGHGTGALRQMVAKLLEKHPHVARFSPAAANQGGTGATLVEIKL